MSVQSVCLVYLPAGLTVIVKYVATPEILIKTQATRNACFIHFCGNIHLLQASYLPFASLLPAFETSGLFGGVCPVAAENHVLALSPQPPLLGVWSQPGTKPSWRAANTWAAVPRHQGKCVGWKQSWGLVHEIWNWLSLLVVLMSLHLRDQSEEGGSGGKVGDLQRGEDGCTQQSLVSNITGKVLLNFAP